MLVVNDDNDLNPYASIMNATKGLKWFRVPDGPTIDNKIFFLHYRFTAPVLLAFSVLVATLQHIGDPISCTQGTSELPRSMLDKYCWIQSTFSESDAWNKEIEVEAAYPGVAMDSSGQKKTYHTYYLWVPFVLFLQAVLFYTPRYVWKSLECGKLEKLILRLNHPVLPEDVRKNNRERLVNYLLSSLNSYHHRLYFLSFVFSEILNFANVIGQLFAMNAFLGGEFLKYGLQVIQFSEWDSSERYDPMLKVFPHVAKCTILSFGKAGDVENDEIICVLPLNKMNEKIFIFLWFWFVILLLLSGLVLLYRCVIIFSPQCRIIVTRFLRFSLANEHDIEVVIKKCNVGDWFFLDLLCSNLDPHNVRDVIADFVLQLKH